MKSYSYRLFTIIAALCLLMGLFALPAFATDMSDNGENPYAAEEVFTEDGTSFDDTGENSDAFADEYAGADPIAGDIDNMGEEAIQDFGEGTEAAEDEFAEFSADLTDEEGINWLFVGGAVAILVVAGAGSFFIASRKGHTPPDQQNPQPPQI